MDKSQQLLWSKLEISDTTNAMSDCKLQQTILLDNFLLCFESQQHIYICDLLNLSWTEGRPSIPSYFWALLETSPMYVMDQNTLVTFGTIYDTIRIYAQVQITTYVFFQSLSIDKAQNPLKMEWKQSSSLTGFPSRKQYSAQVYKSSLYIFGGKGENDSIKDELLIIDLKTYGHFSVSPKVKPNKRYDHSSLVHNGKLFIYGGMTENKVYLNDIWAWNLKNHSSWECIFSNDCFENGFVPAPTSLSLMQGFGNTLFILQKHKESTSNTLLSYDMDSYSWENCNLDKNASRGELRFFAVYNHKFIIGKNFDIYEADLFYQGSLIKSKPRRENNVINDYKTLLIERQFCDITFKVEGEEISAHKGILAQRSDYFMKMFSSKMLESQSQIIEVPEIKCTVFKALLEFLYCGSTNITEEIALDLFKLSDEYQLEELKEECETFIMYHITPKCAIDILLVADKLEAFNMRKAALQYIISNIKAINEVDKISRLGDSVLCELIDRKSD